VWWSSPAQHTCREAGVNLRAFVAHIPIMVVRIVSWLAGVDPNSKDPYLAGVQDEAIVPTDFNLVSTFAYVIDW